VLELDGRQVQLLQFWLCSANRATYYYDIDHKSNENTDKYKKSTCCSRCPYKDLLLRLQNVV